MSRPLATLADHHSIFGDAPGGATPTLEKGRGHVPKIRRRGYFLPVEISRERLLREVAEVARYEPSKTIGKPTTIPIVIGSLRRMTPRAIAIAVLG